MAINRVVEQRRVGYYSEEIRLSNFVFRILKPWFEKGAMLIEVYNGQSKRHFTIKRSPTLKEFEIKAIDQGNFTINENLTNKIFVDIFKSEIDNHFKK